ncbi:hypothetical protein CVT25_012420 [Psilocybe cyanescens]|uniref:Uncharacterized protein n=1 Tax=Psilocybe cyanescens TaxID=93625 RepID=A0A409X7U2_PSICY|nr:hypothetical protein CVT25_012420 [Psilocybe cyanescens]
MANDGEGDGNRDDKDGGVWLCLETSNGAAYVGRLTRRCHSSDAQCHVPPSSRRRPPHLCAEPCSIDHSSLCQSHHKSTSLSKRYRGKGANADPNPSKNQKRNKTDKQEENESR